MRGWSTLLYTCNKDAVDKTHTSPHLNARLHQLYKNAVCTSIKHVLNAGLHSSKILETIAENKLATSKINKYFQKTISSTLNEITVNPLYDGFQKSITESAKLADWGTADKTVHCYNPDPSISPLTTTIAITSHLLPSINPSHKGLAVSMYHFLWYSWKRLLKGLQTL